MLDQKIMANSWIMVIIYRDGGCYGTDGILSQKLSEWVQAFSSPQLLFRPFFVPLYLVPLSKLWHPWLFFRGSCHNSEIFRLYSLACSYFPWTPPLPPHFLPPVVLPQLHERFGRVVIVDPWHGWDSIPSRLRVVCSAAGGGEDKQLLWVHSSSYWQVSTTAVSPLM